MYAWFDCGDGRKVYRRIPDRMERARSALPVPMIRRDTIEPVQSMADGRVYDSMSGLRRSYRADGNPQGVEYTEVGDEKRSDPVPPKVTKQECAVLLEKAEAKIARGEVPELRSIHDPL